MKQLLPFAFLLPPSLMLSSAMADQIKPGAMAPDFALLDQNSKEHRLSEYRGKWAVVYFYPKADTPGCTKEACEFRDDIFQFKRNGVILLGISTDNVKSQKEFAAKYHLPFPLLSDPDGEVASQYDSYRNFGPIRFAKRHTFIIDPDGRIAKMFTEVNPKTHSDEVLASLQSLGVQLN
jgi:peroxiredoxin Q/BCP